LSAARRADGLLAGADVDDAIRQQVRARLADLELLERLENVRLERMTATQDGHFDWAGTDALYEQTFQDAGLDMEALSAEEVGERIGQCTVAVELAAVLDHWAAVRRKSRGTGAPGWKKLLRVACVADPDSGRTRVRQALESRGQALRALAAAGDVFDLPPVTLDILGAAFYGDKEIQGKAGVFLREAQQRHPNDFWLNCNLLLFLYDLKPPQLEEAFHFAGVAVALRPDSPGAHNNLGAALYRKGQLDKAIAEYRAALRLNQDFAEAHSNLGQALCAKGYFDKAVAECRAALRIKPDFAEAHCNLGHALSQNGQLEEAIKAFRQALQLKPDYAVAHNDLGVALEHKGQWDEAIAEWRAALRIKPDLAEAHSNLGIGFGQMSRWDEAIAEWRTALRIQPDLVEVHNNLGKALQDTGQLDEAITEYRQVLRIKPDIAEVHNNLGTAISGKGQLNQAIAEYREALRIKPNYPEAHYNFGLALRDQGRFVDALVELKRGHELGSRTPRWSNPSAQWIQQCEQLVELDRKLPAVLSGRQQPANVAERIALAELCQMPCKKQHRAALQLYEQAFAADPKLTGDQPSGPRYNAACAAALAGCGQGENADKLDATERARLRRQALAWLRAEMAAWQRVLEKQPDRVRPVVGQQLKHWQQDSDFAGVRGSDALAKLPEAERHDWQRLWADVSEMVAKLQAKPATTKKPDAK
jgi:tetratricopeptide (TPR) repeat protein